MARLIDITGKAVSGEWGNDDLDGSGIPVLRTTNFTNDGIVNYQDVVTRCITKKNVDTKFLRRGDIIIEKSGGSDKQPVGRVIYFEGEENKYLFNNFTGLLRTKNTKEWLPRYVFYALYANYLNGGTRKFENRTTGLHNLQTDSYVSSFEISKCPMETQQHISAVLDKVSDLIALRKQQLAKLDELVKSKFIELFGDPANNPMQWETMSFRQAGVRLSDGPFGSNLKSEHYVETGVRVIRLGNIGVGRFIDDDRSFISKEHYKKLKKYTCRTGDIVIGTLGDPNLRACLVPEFIECAINKADCVHYIPRTEILDKQFVCQYINCPETLSLAAGMVHGQTRSRISSGQLADMPIFVPPMELQKRFATFVEQTDKSKLTIQRSLDKLELLKKSLMQEYFG